MLLQAWQAQGHGNMVVPAIRSAVNPPWPGTPDKYAYEPYTLGATGGGNLIPVCGRADSSPGTPSTRKSNDPLQQNLIPGGTFEFKAQITAHHYGHMTLQLCPFITNSFTPADFAKKCTVLKWDGGNYDKFWFLEENLNDKNGGVRSKVFNLPSQAELQRIASYGPPAGQNGHNTFTIQWRYTTANSCNSHKDLNACKYPLQQNVIQAWDNTSPPKFGTCPAGPVPLYSSPLGCTGGACCEDQCCSEVFTNCADVAFTGFAHYLAEGAPAPVPAQVIPAPAPQPASGGTGPTPAPAGSGCVRNNNCAVNAWCNDASMVGWCANFKIAGECNSQVQGIWGSGGSSPEPEPETESGAAPAPVVLPVPAPGPVPASGKPWTPEQESPAHANKLPVLSTATCKNLCTALCNNYNLGYSVGINQGWDTSIAPNCQCKHSSGISIPIYFGGCVQKSHATSLLEEHGIGSQFQEAGTVHAHSTKFSHKIATSVSANGQAHLVLD